MNTWLPLENAHKEIENIIVGHVYELKILIYQYLTFLCNYYNISFHFEFPTISKFFTMIKKTFTLVVVCTQHRVNFPAINAKSVNKELRQYSDSVHITSLTC